MSIFGTPTEFINGEADPLASPSRRRGGMGSEFMLYGGISLVSLVLLGGILWWGLFRDQKPNQVTAPQSELPTLPPPSIKTGAVIVPTSTLDITKAVQTLAATINTQYTAAVVNGATVTPTPTTTPNATRNGTATTATQAPQGGVTRIFLVVTPTDTPRVVTATPTATDKVVQITNTPGATQTPHIIVQSPTQGPTQTPWFFITQPPVVTVVMYQTVIFYATQEVTRIVTVTPAPPTSTAASTTAPTATSLTPTATRTP
jgi:cytoskeletal protein RodZ